MKEVPLEDEEGDMVNEEDDSFCYQSPTMTRAQQLEGEKTSGSRREIKLLRICWSIIANSTREGT